VDIRFVYFDLDDTLLDHRHAERAALSDVRTTFAEPFAGRDDATIHETYRACSLPLWRQYAAGAIEKTDLKRGRFEQLLAELNIHTLDAQTVSDHYLRRYAAHWRFVEGARRAFLHVADRFPVGVLTNGFAEIQTQKLDQFPMLRDRTEAVVISEETGYMKPHPQVFGHAADAADTTPDRILYVGDSYYSDVQGGRAAGWQVAWFTRNGHGGAAEEAPRLTFDTWDTLLDRLQ
jgi:HAD superfamily hydrolase (TIGR01549 family)